MSAKGTLASLQAGRAVAALLVLFFHNSNYIFVLDKYWGHDPVQQFFNFGRAGVDYFFVLSGFIIYYVHRQDINRPARFFTYIKKRFLRIYPLYWLILAAIIPIYFLVPSFGLGYQRELPTILSSMLLIYFDGDLHSELAVGWTLYHEVLFYLIFSLMILHQRFGIAFFALWLLSSAAALFLGPFAFPFLFLASPLHLLFGMGMLACIILNRRRIAAPAALAFAGAALFLAAGMEDNYLGLLAEHPRNIIYGLGSVCVLAGLVELERQGRLRVPALLQLMGNASYSIYLTHFTFLSLLAKIFIALGAQHFLPDLVSYFLLAALTVFLGIIVHLFVERPLLRGLGR